MAPRSHNCRSRQSALCWHVVHGPRHVPQGAACPFRRKTLTRGRTMPRMPQPNRQGGRSTANQLRILTLSLFGSLFATLDSHAVVREWRATLRAHCGRLRCFPGGPRRKRLGGRCGDVACSATVVLGQETFLPARNGAGRGTTVKEPLTIRNTGSGDVSLAFSKLHSSSDCVEPRLLKTLLGPGESTQLICTIDRSAWRKKKHAPYISFRTNDPDRRVVRIPFSSSDAPGNTQSRRN